MPGFVLGASENKTNVTPLIRKPMHKKTNTHKRLVLVELRRGETESPLETEDLFGLDTEQRINMARFYRWRREERNFQAEGITTTKPTITNRVKTVQTS